MKASIISLLLMTGLLQADEAGRKDQAPSEPPQFAEDPGAAKSIASLRKERIETLSRLVARYREYYAEGLSDIRASLDAIEELANAQLAAGLPHEEELKVLRKLLQTASEFEEMAKQRVAAGMSPATDHLSAKAQRLRIEIKLRETESTADRARRESIHPE